MAVGCVAAAAGIAIAWQDMAFRRSQVEPSVSM